MRVIITGGTGLIGRALAASMTADGHEMVVLSRNPQHAAGLPSGTRLVCWDGATPQGWGHLVEGAGAIVNLAGENLSEGRWTTDRKARFTSSRVNAGSAIVAAIRAAGQKPGVLIQSSAVGYYGPHGDEIVGENSPCGRDFLARVCVEWEASTQDVERLDVRRAIIRTGVVFSAQGGALPRMLLPYRFFVGGPIGRGRQWIPWIHIADEVRAIRFLIERTEAEGPFNLCAPHPVTNATLARTAVKIAQFAA